MYVNPTLVHLYGPLAIRVYGLMGVIGLTVFLVATIYDRRRVQYIPEQVLHTAFFYGILAGILGSRVLHFLTDYSWDNGFVTGLFDFINVGEPGFSLLGAIIAIPFVVGWYLDRQRISIFLFADIIIVYIPLIQAIFRLGCFAVGCCHGIAANKLAWWTVVYEHPASLAPTGIPLHPAQLYSAAASFSLFLVLLCISWLLSVHRGCIFGFYLFAEGLARFFVDFWRARSEYELMHALKIYEYHVTYYQGISLVIAVVGVAIMVIGFLLSEKRAS